MTIKKVGKPQGPQAIKVRILDKKHNLGTSLCSIEQDGKYVVDSLLPGMGYYIDQNKIVIRTEVFEISMRLDNAEVIAEEIAGIVGDVAHLKCIDAALPAGRLRKYEPKNQYGPLRRDTGNVNAV